MEHAEPRLHGSDACRKTQANVCGGATVCLMFVFPGTSSDGPRRGRPVRGETPVIRLNTAEN
jgi:hypothetical protein